MSLVKCGNVIDLVLFFSQDVQTEKPGRALFETFTVIYVLKKWKWIDTDQPEL